MRKRTLVGHILQELLLKQLLHGRLVATPNTCEHKQFGICIHVWLHVIVKAATSPAPRTICADADVVLQMKRLLSDGVHQMPQSAKETSDIVDAKVQITFSNEVAAATHMLILHPHHALSGRNSTRVALCAEYKIGYCHDIPTWWTWRRCLC